MLLHFYDFVLLNKVLNFIFICQFALLVLHLGEEDNQYSNVLEMDEIVLPFEWHSFCISININKKKAKVIHNGHIQAIQTFEKLEDETEDKSRFMTLGHLGGENFVGLLLDFEVFGSPLPDKNLLQWTLCENQVQDKTYDVEKTKFNKFIGNGGYVFPGISL